MSNVNKILKEKLAADSFDRLMAVDNTKIHASRRLGAGTIDLADFLSISKQQGVSVNEVALATVGAALERYSQERGLTLKKPLIAACPIALRREGDGASGNQIAALSVKLGEPGSDIVERLTQVHNSSADAKDDAKSVSREALMNYQLLVGGVAGLLGQTPFADKVPPLTNVNVSNVAGPRESFYLSGSKMVQTFPASVLAMGSAINITFGSMEDRMDFAIISDARTIPDAQKIADYITDEFNALHAKVNPGKKAGAPRKAARKKATTKRATPKKTATRKKTSRKI